MSERQIALSAAVARTALDLNPSDTLLDLGCGNGLVTIRLAEACRAVYAVDYSKDLIEIARRHYAAPNLTYFCCDATELTAARLDNLRPSKIAMLAGLQYFTVAMLKRLLAAVKELTGAAAPLFFSDIPDADHLYDFYDTPERRAYYERQRAMGLEPMGTWWSRAHLAQLLGSAGYATEFHEQEAQRYAAYYHRFDLLARPLQRSDGKRRRRCYPSPADADPAET
jgi:cyclopropane fatty-acyl-phospholipid synthase-like methyltransferase